jgi:hypothetical protein
LPADYNRERLYVYGLMRGARLEELKVMQEIA